MIECVRAAEAVLANQGPTIAKDLDGRPAARDWVGTASSVCVAILFHVELQRDVSVGRRPDQLHAALVVREPDGDRTRGTLQIEDMIVRCAARAAVEPGEGAPV